MSGQGAPLLILGTGVFAEEVADLVEQQGTHPLAGFVENLDRSRCGRPLLGRPVHWVDEVAPLAGTHLAVCAISTNRRRAYIELIAALGFRFATVRHPSAIVSPAATIEPGCVCSAGVIVATQSRIGAHTILNRGVLIGHHTTVGAFVTISPGANLAGLVRIGEGSYIGMGAVILDRIGVGEGALVGAGAVVTRDVAAHHKVLGVPARVVAEGVDGR